MPKGGKTVEEMRGDGRGETEEEAFAWFVIPPGLQHEKKPLKADNLSRLTSYVSPGGGMGCGPLPSSVSRLPGFGFHMARRTVVLLTLNEVDGVRWLFSAGHDLSAMADEVFAVDGGSTDGTREVLASRHVRIVDQPRPGRGEAFRAAVRASSGACLVFFSPDGNEDPDDIPRLFAAIENGADMAIASRFLPGSRNEEDDDSLPLRKWTTPGVYMDRQFNLESETLCDGYDQRVSRNHAGGISEAQSRIDGVYDRI